MSAEGGQPQQRHQGYQTHQHYLQPYPQQQQQQQLQHQNHPQVKTEVKTEHDPPEPHHRPNNDAIKTEIKSEMKQEIKDEMLQAAAADADSSSSNNAKAHKELGGEEEDKILDDLKPEAPPCDCFAGEKSEGEGLLFVVMQILSFFPSPRFRARWKTLLISRFQIPTTPSVSKLGQIRRRRRR